jgi:hypothetical protein
MILGMSVATFTLVHVALSLVGILTGLVVLFGMFSSKKLPTSTALFLATTVLTSATGFFFPRDHILPAYIVGVISLAVLAVAIFALYERQLAGSWRWIYVAGAVIALYLNVFVGVVQAFQKLPFFGKRLLSTVLTESVGPSSASYWSSVASTRYRSANTAVQRQTNEGAQKMEA